MEPLQKDKILHYEHWLKWNCGERRASLTFDADDESHLEFATRFMGGEQAFRLDFKRQILSAHHGLLKLKRAKGDLTFPSDLSNSCDDVQFEYVILPEPVSFFVDDPGLRWHDGPECYELILYMGDFLTQMTQSALLEDGFPNSELLSTLSRLDKLKFVRSVIDV